MMTLVDRYPGLDNPMTFGDYYASHERTLTCPTCGKVWELYGSEWETPGTMTSDKVPVVDGVCRSCVWHKGQDDEGKLLAFMRAEGLEKRVLQSVLLNRMDGAANDGIWADIAPVIAESRPEIMAAATLDYIQDEQLVPEYVDFLMGV